jgi:D-alanine-D-alanine ligase-like ATP-grasp enzyme
LKLAAKEAGYKVRTLLAHYSDAVMVSNQKRFFIARSKKIYGMYPLNPKFAEHFVDDKGVFKKVLKKKGFHVIKGRRFYIKSPLTGKKVREEDNISAAIKYADSIRFPVFVKPNVGSQGKNARIIFNKTALRDHIRRMKADKTESFLVEKFTSHPEYRLFVVDGKIKFFYSKERKSIKGDGKSTIKELVRANKIKLEPDSLKALLSLYDLKKSDVLLEGERIILQETGNISTGAKIINYCDSNISDSMQAWAKRLQNNCGLRVFGVDIFAREGGIDNPDDYLIIEINSNPALSGIYAAGHKKQVFKIWEEICRKQLDNKR